ncbi:MAG: gamma-glutamyltransferase family protein [Pseudomonadota bacterium]
MFTTRPEIQGTFGVVGSTHWLATQAAMTMLERGGNAFDAAVSGGFALQVVEPHLNGPGGEVPILLHAAGSGETKVVCGQGVAPAGATIEHYRNEGLTLIPGSGLLATVVPGAFDAWMIMLRDYGQLMPADVLEHAIAYAEGGYPIVGMITQTIERVEDLFRDHWPTSAATYLPGGAIPQAGSIFRNQPLAETYKRLLAEGQAAGGDRVAQIEAMRKAWYQGFVAEEIERFCRETAVMDASGAPHKGVLTGQDMANWQASYEEPTTLEYEGLTVCKNGFWSQGPVFLQQLAILKGYDLAALDPLGPDFVHLTVEAAKLALADREAYYGDPNFVKVPSDTLLSEAYAAQRRAQITDSASQELLPGDIPGFDPTVEFTRKGEGGEAEFDALGGGEPTAQGATSSLGAQRGDTCHIDVADRWGNMVSATPSGSWLQSSPIIPALGFCLNSRAQMFWMKEGVPASLAPGKRPRTTLSVNLVLRDGQPLMVFGTPGGDYQDQWTPPFFLRHVHHAMNLQEAIDAPAYHSDHMPSSFFPRAADLGSLSLEDRFPAATIEELKRRGHRVSVVDGWSLGRISAARKDGELLRAGANPRFQQGYAVGR